MSRLTETIKKNYENKVLVLRLRAGFVKQKDFAAKVGISPTILCYIESNRTFLSSVYALRIAEVLDCSLGALYERKTPLIDSAGSHRDEG